jgi:His-Xaa-Ser system radical SAM maturase HxsC
MRSMIALSLPAYAENSEPFVARLTRDAATSDADLSLVDEAQGTTAYAGTRGLVTIEHADRDDLDGDVVLVTPLQGRVERLIRKRSRHNTLLVTERCDQLCVMCSQPPKKTHDDRFELLERACLLAEPDAVIGITGGEPLLYKKQLFGLIERVLAARPRMSFHVLTNGQHFEPSDAERLAHSDFRRVQWGIPLYSPAAAEHDLIVGKQGAFEQLEDSLATLASSGASIELRTVLLTTNVGRLPALARHIAQRLPFIATWSIMQLENIGFARNRWGELRFDHALGFTSIAGALDIAAMRGISTQLYNFPRCTVPAAYRDYAVASISDWKQRFGTACGGCREKSHCSGFFEWHPIEEIEARATPL